jgi:hypothetical protein
MAKIKTALEVLLFGIVVAFVCAMALMIFVDLFWSSNPKPTEAFYSSFFGALLAFISVRLTEALNRFYNAGRDSRRALGRIQFTLNEAMGIVNDNKFVLEQWHLFVIKLGEAKASGRMLLFGNRFEVIPDTSESLYDIESIGLANELMLLNSGIRKMNDSLATWHSTYLDAKSAFMGKQIDVATYLANVEATDTKAKEIERFLRALMDEIMESLCMTRMLLRPKPFLAKTFGWINSDNYMPTSDPERQREMAALLQEAKQISEESRKRIAAISSAKPTVGRS